MCLGLVLVAAQEVLNELLIPLVDGVVGKMCILGFFGGPRVVIGLACEAGETLIVHIDPQWLKACYHDVDPKVELQAVQQQGVVYVSTDDKLLIHGDLLDVLHQEDTLPLR